MRGNLRQDLSMGPTLKRLRKAAGLTQAQVSAQLEVMGINISEDILAKIEQGKYSIRLSVLVALKQIYKVTSFDAFFEDLIGPVTDE